jgi:glucose/arabinose dehydrogenase
MRRLAALIGALTMATAGLTSCSDDGSDTPEDTVTATPQTETPSATESPTGTSEPATPDASPPKVVGTVATGLAVPWGITFLPNGDAVVTERDTGRVLLIQGPEHQVQPIGEIAGAAGGQGTESGLLGVAASPEYDTDQTLYFYVTTAADNRIVRARVEGGRLGSATVLLNGIPRGPIHDGGRLAFGPDGYLYASTGETGDAALAQDKGTPAGKILRITTDGDPAPGNPFPDSPIWSYGHRNVQGLAFDDTGRLWASEFGQNTFDELNLIRKGRNYGWPMVEGQGGGKGLVDPQVVWDTDVASPSGLAFLDGRLWLASLRGERLWRIDVAGNKASKPTDFFVGEYGRMRTVVVAPDGRLWLTTSNLDGRGDPREGDDQILIVEP